MKKDIVTIKKEQSDSNREITRIYLNNRKFSGDYFMDEIEYKELFESQIKQLQYQGCKIVFE